MWLVVVEDTWLSVVFAGDHDDRVDIARSEVASAFSLSVVLSKTWNIVDFLFWGLGVLDTLLDGEVVNWC